MCKGGCEVPDVQNSSTSQPVCATCDAALHSDITIGQVVGGEFCVVCCGMSCVAVGVDFEVLLSLSLKKT